MVTGTGTWEAPDLPKHPTRQTGTLRPQEPYLGLRSPLTEVRRGQNSQQREQQVIASAGWWEEQAVPNPSTSQSVDYIGT